MAVLVGAIFILEIIDFQLAWCRKVNKLKSTFDDYERSFEEKKLTYFNLNDLNKEIGKRKFVLYDNYVCDVEKYIKEHPGGAKMIEDNLYSDMARYMTGTQPYSKDYKAYDHNFATTKRLLQSMCYGMIKDNNGIVVNSLTERSNLSNVEILEIIGRMKVMNESYSLLLERREIATKFYEFRFGSQQKLNFARFLQGVSWIGRHFSLASTGLNKTRYYSLCLSLNPVYIEKLLLLTENIRRLERKETVQRVTVHPQELYSNYLSLYIKHYNFKGALTDHMMRLALNSQSDLIIKGPLVNIY